MILSVLHVANVELFRQSTSRVGAASHIAFLSSTLASKHTTDMSSINSKLYTLICALLPTAVRHSYLQRASCSLPVWNSNCCLTSPVRPSQMMAVLSTEPDSSRSPFLFHFREKMGPL